MQSRARVPYYVYRVHALLWTFVPKVPYDFSGSTGESWGTDLHGHLIAGSQSDVTWEPLIFLVCSVGETGLGDEGPHIYMRVVLEFSKGKKNTFQMISVLDFTIHFPHFQYEL